MKGSKRVPILQIESRGAASIDLWCNTVPAQLVVADATLTVILGASDTEAMRCRRACRPMRTLSRPCSR